MGTADTSSRTSEDLPEDESRQGSSTNGGNQGSEGLSTDSEKAEGLTPKEKKGFQRLVAKKDDQIQDLESKLDKYNRQLAEYREKERNKKLENMSEAEKWKTKAKEYAQEAAQTRLNSLVTREAAKRDISDHPVVDILLETPWAFPAVRKRLTEDSNWDETIELVQTHLPSYLDTLVEPENTTPQAEVETPEQGSQPEPSAEGMETERSGPAEVNKRSWTGEEIKSYLEDAQDDPEEYKKRQIEVTKAANEGRVQ